MGCNECGFAYSFVFGVQFHAADCTIGRREQVSREIETKVAATDPKRFLGGNLAPREEWGDR